MKAKKAIKRLSKVETLLSNVIDQYPASDRRVRVLLGSAKVSVTRAKATVSLDAHPRAARKPPAKAHSAQPGRLTAEGRKRISRAAKKRWAEAKRKGLHAVTGRRLSKTA